MSIKEKLCASSPNWWGESVPRVIEFTEDTDLPPVDCVTDTLAPFPAEPEED